MKRFIYACSFLIISALSVAAITETSCDSKALKKEGIAELNPFYYSASKITNISYEYRISKKEIEVPLFKGEKYRMVFNKKGLPKDVIVEVYDKDKSHDGREPLFTSKDNTENIISFEPKKSKKMYVNYVIPKANGIKETGCIAFVLGYQLSFLKEDKEKEEEVKE